jgi:GNAT superfamily N-acetyltransferase
MKTRIRTASVSDIGALILLARRTISASYRAFLGDEAVDAFLGSGAADRYVEENIGHCWVLVREGEIVGYAVCRDNRIDLMMIDHTLHRQGLGTELLGHVEQVLLQRHAELHLESFADNQSANAFYRKHGWREVNRSLAEDSRISKIVFQKQAEGRTNRCP